MPTSMRRCVLILGAAGRDFHAVFRILGSRRAMLSAKCRSLRSQLAALADLDAAACTIEEREEYKPHIMTGLGDIGPAACSMCGRRQSPIPWPSLRCVN